MPDPSPSTALSGDPSHSPKHLWMAVSVVAAVVAAVFARSLGNGFVNWDDQVYVLDNPHIRALDWGTVRWAFTDNYAAYWAPAVWLSFAVDHAFWGLQPHGYHLTNVLLHVATAAIVCVFAANVLAARRNAGRPWSPTREDLAGGVLVALLWGIHPLRVESVTWVTERKDVLSGLFSFWSMLSYLQWVNRRRTGTQAWPVPAASLAALAVALCAKPLSVVVVPLLWILDWHPLERDREGRLGKLVLEKVPHLLLCLGVGLLFMRAQQSAMPVPASLQTKVYTAAKVLLDYVGMQLWPVHLVPLYPRTRTIPWGSPAHLLALAVLPAAAVLLVRWARRERALLAAGLWHLVSVGPMLGLLQVGPQEKADRYTYLASLGLALLLAGASLQAWKRWSKPAARALLAGAWAVALITLAGLTVRQIGHWKDGVALWSHEIDVSPDVGYAWELRAKALAAAGESERAVADLTQAIAIAQAKGYAKTWELYWAKGIVLARMARDQEAVGALTTAVRGAHPPPPDLLRRRGESLRRLGRADEATADFAAADALGRERTP